MQRERKKKLSTCKSGKSEQKIKLYTELCTLSTKMGITLWGIKVVKFENLFCAFCKIYI